MPAAVAVPAAIGLGSSIFGGIKGSSAAKKAAQLQYQAAQQAMTKIQSGLDATNPQIQSAADQARTDAIAAARAAGVDLTGAAGAAGDRLIGAAGTANDFLNPYIKAGQGAVTNLADLLAPGGQLRQQFGAEQMQTMDPGYQFRIDMANKALQASAAARGGALGGGALRSLQTQSQNLASSEMQNAFDRWNTQQNNLYTRLTGLSGQGLTAGTQAGANLLGAYGQAGNWNTAAAGQAGNWLTQGTQYGGTAEQNAALNIANNTMGGYRSIADLMTGGAAAQAGGVVGSANAWNGALSGVANTANQVGGYYNQKELLSQLMNPQQTARFTPYASAKPFNPYETAGNGLPYFVNPSLVIPKIPGVNS